MRLINFFSSADEDFVRQNFKDPNEAEKLIASFRKRATIGVFVVTSFLIVATLAVGYAMGKTTSAMAEMKNIEAVQVKIEQCISDTHKQANDAATAKTQAEEANRNIQAQLEDCSRKQNKK